MALMKDITLVDQKEKSSVESWVASMAGYSVVKRTGKLVVKTADRSASH